MVSKIESFVLLGLVLVFTILFSLNLVSAALNITSPVDGTNYTKTNIFFNVSYTNSTDSIANPTNVTFFAHPNGNATRIAIGSLNGSATCSNTACWMHINLTLDDGNYTINATIYNGSVSVSVNGTVNSSTDVRFASNGPRVLAENFTSPSIGYNYSHSVFGILVLNVSIIDFSGVGIQSVYFNITNSSGAQNTTLTATNPTGLLWNASIDTRTVPDGLYNVTVWTNDTLGNLNNSARIYSVTIDNSAPSASLSCTPNPVEQGDSISCTCSGIDAQSGIRSTSTGTPSTAESGPHTVSCSATNHANLTTSTTYDYTVAGSASTASGGSSGGSSSALVSSTGKVQRTFDSISAGDSKTISGLDSSYAIKSLEITVNNKVQDVKVTINKFNDKPASVSVAKTGKVYKYLEISATNVEGKVDKATIKTLVSKKWVSDNQLTSDKVALFRLVNSAWVELPTTVSEEGSNYVLTSTSPGFSYFSIAEKVSPVKDVEAVAKDTYAEKMPLGENTGNSMLWVIGIVIVLVVVLVIYFVKKKVTSPRK